MVPVSWKTTGRIGDSRRHSHGFWSRLLRSAKRVHGFGPGRIGALALIEGGEPETVDRVCPSLAG